MALLITKQTFPGAGDELFDYSNYANNHYVYVNTSNITMHYHMDSSYHLTKIVRSGNVRGTDESYTYRYDYDAKGQITRKVLPSGREVLVERAANGRQGAYKLKGAAGTINLRSFAHSEYGNATRVTHADGTITDFVYDANGNKLTSVHDPSGLAISNSWDYDAKGNVLTHTNGEGEKVIFLRNAGGELTKKIIDPVGLAITHTYLRNATGKTTRYIDPKGSVWISLYASSGKNHQECATQWTYNAVRLRCRPSPAHAHRARC